MGLFLFNSPTPNIESNYPQFFRLGSLCYRSVFLSCLTLLIAHKLPKQKKK